MRRECSILLVLGMVLAGSGASWGAVDPSLVGWWRLDESSGTVAADASGQGNDGTLGGAAAHAPGLFGRGLYFDGSEAYLEVPNVLTATSTLAFWFKPDWDGTDPADYRLFDASFGAIYFFVSKGANHGDINPEDFGFYLEDAADTDFQNIEIPAAGAFTADTWYHVAVTWEFGGGSAIVYLNGEEIATGNNLGNFPDLSPNLRFGYETISYIPITNGAGAVIDDIKIFDRVLAAEEIPGVMQGAALELAGAPSPADEATNVPRDVSLSWLAGIYAATHDVYFGTDFDDVNDASRASPLGVLVSQGQAVESYDPPVRLDFGTTYHWRVDEVNAPPTQSTIFKGATWSFTTEPRYYAVENITATASVATAAASGGPETIVDGSGLAGGLHGNVDATMWSGAKVGDDPVRLQFDFDRVYKLYGMHVWNYNGLYEFFLGFGVQDATIEYATEPNEWTTLGDYQFGRGTGKADYAGELVDLDGLPARSIRITVNSTFGGRAETGLSEIQFLHKPVFAREPQPADGTTEAGIDVTLGWRAGREAASHQVHFGADPNAVADGAALLATVAANTYDLPTLDLGTTYYWQIVEVNEAETPTAWSSALWSFSTAASILVDGFETYTDDEGNRVYEAWADGFGDPSNGSQVGHDNPPYAEETIVHGGDQAMPMQYGQDGATTSEAKMTLGAAQDWTAGGATTLVVYFRGDVSNAAGQLYVKVNGTRVDYPGDTAALAAPLWKQWNIDLAALGNTARSVTSLTIGVAGAGTGLLYVDDIRLYHEAPPMPGPAVDPGVANLVALYTMEGSLADGSGNGRDGTAEVGSSFGPGLPGYGQALVLDGTSGHATLPIGPLVQSLGSATFATWVNWAGSGSLWCRIFDFGSGTDVYMFLTPNSGGGMLRFAITTSSSGGESQLNRPGILAGGWHHVAVTIDGAAMTMQMYLDGELVDSDTTNTLPSALGNTTQNYLGRSQWDDPYLPGSLDDFRIYNRALSEAEVRYLVGDR